MGSSYHKMALEEKKNVHLVFNAIHLFVVNCDTECMNFCQCWTYFLQNVILVNCKHECIYMAMLLCVYTCT